MRIDFRTGMLVGLGATLAIGLYCVWLWRPQHQIERHTQNLLHKIEQKNWAAVADLIGAEYADQWGDDRALLLERMRLGFGYGHHLRLDVAEAVCKIDNGVGVWRGRIAIDSDDAELLAVVKERVNSLRTPFELQWRRFSGKPWDWKLVRVSNPELQIPAGFD
jgi:hypothetical protein